MMQGLAKQLEAKLPTGDQSAAVIQADLLKAVIAALRAK
jgi:hypothetical protein